MVGNDDWDRVESIYELIKGELSGFDLISPIDLERFRLSKMTFGHVKSDLLQRLQQGRALNVTEGQIEKYHDLMLIAFSLSGGRVGADSVPLHMQKHFTDIVAPRAVIETALAKRCLTPAFLVAWTQLCVLYGAFDATRGLPAPATKRFTDAARGSLEIQSYWFARWLGSDRYKKRDEDQAKTDASHDLAFLCKQIKDKRIHPWGAYPIEWYTSMLAKGDEELSDRFHRLSGPALAKMQSSPILTEHVLPPTDPTRFAPVVKKPLGSV